MRIQIEKNINGFMALNNCHGFIAPWLS